MGINSIINSIPGQRNRRAVRDVYDHLNTDIEESKMVNIHGGADYYVDGNAASAGDGSSWDEAFDTLAAAISASNTSIGLSTNRWWARRNRIFCAGDTLDEDLTRLPTKCDVIGVGSNDAQSMCGLKGYHSTDDEAYGTRFFNMEFVGEASANPIFTLAGSNDASGVQFHGCRIDANAGTLTHFVKAVAMPYLVINNCDFAGTFATAYVEFDTGQAGGARITNNKMLGTAAKGIVVASDTTATWIPVIENNIIKATGLVIDDDSDLFYIVNNRMITEADPLADSTGAVDANQVLAIGNMITSDAGTERNAEWPFQVQFTS